MYVIAGVTGRVGSATAKQLLAAGANIRVLMRREHDAAAWQDRGAQTRIVGLEDRTQLAAALDGATGFFVLLPFDLTVDDLDAHADTLIASIVGAVNDQRVPHVVMLSSGGADLAAGTGPITGLHRLEQALRATGAIVTALRSGHFQEKLTDVMDAVHSDGVYPVLATSADVPVPMVATRDIGTIAAQMLLSPPEHSQTVDIIGPAYTERAVATTLGNALGRELNVTTIPEHAWSGVFVDAGFAPHIAESLAELYRADQRGLLEPRGDRRVHVSTKIENTITHILTS